MNDDFLKKISSLSKLRDQINSFSKQRDQIRSFSERLDQIGNVFRSLINAAEERSRAFEAIKRNAIAWQNRQKQNVVAMAESGWFPNWYTFDYEPEVEENDIDKLMTMHLNDCWSELTGKIIKLCPNRKNILDTAFSLHKEGNYIASIPLLISQADGIFCEEIKTFIFADNKDHPVFKGERTEEYLNELLEKDQLEVGCLVGICLEPYKVKTQFAEGVKRSSAERKKKGPNRNGILHGHKDHLDYGTELNSLKSLSLLAFVVYSTKEIFKTQSLHQKKIESRQL